MLIYSAHLPHSPILLPQLVGKKISQFRKTRASVAEIAFDLYAHKIETVIFLTPHLPLKLINAKNDNHNAFVINVSPHYVIDLVKFGDLATRDALDGDNELALALSEPHPGAPSEQPTKIITEEKLDTATSSVIAQLIKPAMPSLARKQIKNPEHSFTKNPPPFTPKIVPITYALTKSDELLNFGQTLREAVEMSHKRIAIISLGDLSRTNQKNQAQAEEIDKNIIKYLKDNDLTALENLDLKSVDSLGVSGFRSLLILLGALLGSHYQAEILSYEHKECVGLMVARFVF